MKRQTRTELDKIIFIGMSKIDQLVNKLCDDCVTPRVEVEQPARPVYSMTVQETIRMRERVYQLNHTDPFCSVPRMAGEANNYNGCRALAGQTLGIFI